MSPKAGTATREGRTDIEDEETPVSPVIFFDEDDGIDDDEVLDHVVFEPDEHPGDPLAGTETGTETGAEATSPTTRWWRRGAPRGATAVTGLVAVVLAVVLVLALMAKGNSDAVNAARVSGLAAARTDAVALSGYNYEHLNRDFDSVLARSTPAFRRNFRQASNALKGTLTKFHATSVGHVVSAGVVSASASRVVALVFLTQKIENSTQSSATTDRSQVEFTLLKVHGRWLIDQVTLL
ncbi:MAG: hypothetical protein ACRDY1_00120 [Acidimicrobiales bacterium]